ncbi:MAG: DNA polymerase III subunit gamma/tau [Proteocatella sp.]|nr:DNA polymerase III subunit gamma/tau [Proteocatella sp.]
MQQALYRIYRPKNFDEIYGQDQIVSILKNQLENGNLSHAYLFCGPRGTGKTSTAKVFASAINGGIDIDTVELDAASNNSVDNVRDIRDNLAFAPTSGKYKIYIIDEVHMLSAAAFNALLKTLEEPPSHVIFILATTEPQKIPQTVLSRCQRFDFRKIEKDVLVQRLSDVLAQEGKDFESEALEFIALKSEGGLRDALSILDKALSYGDLTMENLLQVLGEIHSDNYLSMLKAIMAHNTRDAIMVLGSIEKSGMDPRIFALELINFMKQVILEFNDVKQDNPNVSQAAQICTDEIAANIIEDLSTTCSNMRYSPQPQVLLLADIVRITGTRYDGIGSNRDVSEDIRAEFALMNSEIRRLETLVQGLESRLSEIESNPQLPVGNIEGSVENSGRMAITSHTKGPSSTKSPSRVSAKKIERVEISDDEKAELDRVNDAIPILYEELRAVKQAQLAALIREGKPERFFDDNIFFCFEEKNIFHKNMLETQDINNSVEKILSKLLKRNIAVQYILYSELASIKSKKISDEEKLIEKLSETFPDVNIDIKP